MVLPAALFAQRRKQVYNPNYDQRWISYGFLLQGHTSAYQIEYSEAFVSDAFDSVFAISPRWSTGFSLGFIVNMRLAEFFDLRFTPTVYFQVSGRNRNEELGDEYLITKEFNFSGELGFGGDIYYPLFKFSPEIRFSKGFVNLLGDENNAYGAGLRRINTNTISLILFFQ